MKPRRQSFALAIWIVFSSAIVALLVPAQAANAALITRNVNVTLNALALNSFNLDVDLNGTTDFTFVTAFDPIFGDGFDVVNFPLGSKNGVVIDAPSPILHFPNASRLALGSTVSSANIFSNALLDQANLFDLTGFDPPTGNFGGKTGFLGLRFDGAGGSLFGFAQVTVNAADALVNPLGLTIGTVGFNNLPGQLLAIPTAVSEPGSLWLFALAGLTLVVVSRRGRARIFRDGTRCCLASPDAAA